MEPDGLFDLDDASAAAPPVEAPPASAPLAVRMRPRTLAEVVGQQHLLRPGAPLRRLVEGGAAASVLLYGPPGTGKTTIARLLASSGDDGGRHFVALSALNRAECSEYRTVTFSSSYRAFRSSRHELYSRRCVSHIVASSRS